MDITFLPSKLPVSAQWRAWLESLTDAEYDFATAFEAWWTEGGRQPMPSEKVTAAQAVTIRATVKAFCKLNGQPW